MTTRTATARYTGFGKSGKGALTTQSGILTDTQYGFNSRFEDGAGTNPEELIAAAHAGCFTMALSFALAGAGFSEGSLETKAKVTLEAEAGGGFTITRSDLTLTASIAGIAPEQFELLAQGAKENCPVSKLFNAELTLEWTLN